MRKLFITEIVLILSSHAIEIISCLLSQNHLRSLIHNNRLLSASNEFTSVEGEETNHQTIKKENNINNNNNDISELPNLIIPPFIIMTRH